MWGATTNTSTARGGSGNFNPRSPCGERRWRLMIIFREIRFQSTLPVWGATILTSPYMQAVCISIHAPRVGSDSRTGVDGFSTPISIHAPRVGSDDDFSAASVFDGISIHAPRVGSDAEECRSMCTRSHFNPRSPCGERLPMAVRSFPFPAISIHAPRVGSDSRPCGGRTQSSNFNPRSPCGERLVCSAGEDDG